MAPPKRKGGRTIPATKDDTATSARVTAKGSGTKPMASSSTGDEDHPGASTRYTPPTPRIDKMDMPSPMWVPVLMFGLLGLGALLIVLNYLGVLPGDTDNKYLAVGLVMILGGIVTATQYR